jgi:hypothetical protein
VSTKGVSQRTGSADSSGRNPQENTGGRTHEEELTTPIIEKRFDKGRANFLIRTSPRVTAGEYIIVVESKQRAPLRPSSESIPPACGAPELNLDPPSSICGNTPHMTPRGPAAHVLSLAIPPTAVSAVARDSGGRSVATLSSSNPPSAAQTPSVPSLNIQPSHRHQAANSGNSAPRLDAEEPCPFTEIVEELRIPFRVVNMDFAMQKSFADFATKGPSKAALLDGDSSGEEDMRSEAAPVGGTETPVSNRSLQPSPRV